MSTLSTVMASIFAISGSLFVIAALVNVRAAHRLRREGLTTEGTVTKVEDDPVNDGWTTHIRYHVEGEPFTLRTGIGRWTVGEKTIVRYRPRDPGQASLDTRAARWFLPILWSSFALLFWLAASLLVILSRSGVL